MSPFFGRGMDGVIIKEASVQDSDALGTFEGGF
jgi:hypothetical protein